MARRILLGSLLLVCSVITGVSTSARELVEIRLHGYYYAEPATVQVIVAVEPHASNRVLRLEADGERMFRSMDIPLVGEGEKRLHTIELKNLLAGTYMLRAEVLASNDSLLGMAERELTVTGQ